MFAPIYAAIEIARRDQTRQRKSDARFEETIRHLTPERQAELRAIRQIQLESVRRRR